MTSKTNSKIILPGAWELTDNAHYELFSLSVPTQWQQAAKALAQQRYQRLGKGYPSVPVRSLDRIIAASFPNIIQTARNGWKYPSVPWIFATEKADLSDLPELIKDWLREEFSDDLGEEEVDSTLEKLENDSWQWGDSKTYSLLHPPADRDAIDLDFQAIPHYLAEKFLKNPIVQFGNNCQHELTFYRVVCLDRGAELMSWPPRQVYLEKKNKAIGEAYLSFVIRFKLQTVPWRDRPLIYSQLSIRRWIVKPFENYPYRGATVYVGDNRRWLDGVRQPFRLIPLKITRKGKKLQWHKALHNLLELNDSSLPNINTLAFEPAARWSAIREAPVGIQAAIVYNNRWGEEPCKPGVSPLDLYQLDRAICDRIDRQDLPLFRAGEATNIGTSHKTLWGKGQSQSRSDKTPKNRDHLSTVMLRPTIAAPATFRLSEHSPNTILILWETEDCRDALVEEICTVLELSLKVPKKSFRSSPEKSLEEIVLQGKLGALKIKTQHVVELTQKLDLDSLLVSGQSTQQKRIYLIKERVKKISLFLPKA
ncbi:MAG: DUF3962 domain-containing protein [Geitlerinemataceae cyanobacterium]